MPLLDLATDERHPVNRMRAIHQASLAVLGEGGTLEPAAFLTWVQLGTTVMDRRAAERTANAMAELGMIIQHKGSHVEVRPLSEVVLPDGWQEPAGTPAPGVPTALLEAPVPLAA